MNLLKKHQIEPNLHLIINYIRKDNGKYKNNVMKNKFSKFCFWTSKKIGWLFNSLFPKGTWESNIMPNYFLPKKIQVFFLAQAIKKIECSIILFLKEHDNQVVTQFSSINKNSSFFWVVKKIWWLLDFPFPKRT